MPCYSDCPKPTEKARLPCRGCRLRRRRERARKVAEVKKMYADEAEKCKQEAKARAYEDEMNALNTSLVNAAAKYRAYAAKCLEKARKATTVQVEAIYMRAYAASLRRADEAEKAALKDNRSRARQEADDARLRAFWDAEERARGVSDN